MSLLKKLGLHVKLYRTKQTLSYLELAKFSGIRLEYLKKIEQGEAKNVTIGHIKRLCDCFNISLKDFLREIEY